MFDDGRKKRFILIGCAVGILLLLVLLIAFFTLKNPLSSKENNKVDGEKVVVNGVGSSGSMVIKPGPNGVIVGEEEDKEVVEEVIEPSKKLKGAIDSCEISGSYGKLDILESGIKTSVELKIGSIIFDTVTNKVILPSDVKKGSKLDVYVYSDLDKSKLDLDLAEVVIVSPPDDVGYVPMVELKIEGNKLKFKNSSDSRDYIVNGALYSALDGREYTEEDISKLSDGDRLIYYGVIKEDKVIIEKGYVYPLF